jgi:FHS family L-fucose permease-like MFS transporter
MKPTSVSAALLSVTTLFFAWGFITSNNDPLIAALKASFDLTYTEALMIQLVSFAAFGIVSLPAAGLLARVGAPRSILLALAVMICGCLLVRLVAPLQNFSLILSALFVLAAGVTTLQVAANPLAAALGPPESSHFRLTFAQAFNSLGVVIGVSFGSKLMLEENVLHAGRAGVMDPAQRAAALTGVAHAFSIMALLLAGLLLFAWISLRRVNGPAGEGGASLFAALKSGWATFGAIAIALYVGAEVAISSVMINFLNQDHILGVSLEAAGIYLANIYWMGALAGRFIGSVLLTRIAAPRLLLGAATAAMSLCAAVAMTEGPIAAYSALAVGLFNSIMFPTIFSITLERARSPKPATSGLLCLAIVGGAALPYAVGKIADLATLSIAFAAPALAYAAIAAFAGMAASSHNRSDMRERPLPVR